MLCFYGVVASVVLNGKNARRYLCLEPLYPALNPALSDTRLTDACIAH